MAKSTQSRAKKKPRKPDKDFPLYAHANGQWAKKVRGRTHFFGTWDDPEGAAQEWLRQKDYLLAGRAPPEDDGAITVKELFDFFLAAKKDRMACGELAPRTYDRYEATAKYTGRLLGKWRPVASLTPDDFQKLRKSIARRYGPVATGNEIQMVRSIFKYGYDSGKLDRPVRFGPDFAKPSARTLRLARLARGPRMFTAEQLRAILDKATVNLKAMVLLAINGGLGNTDLAALPRTALDLDSGWLTYPRQKTGVPRRIPLWTETVMAIREALKQPRKPLNPRDHRLVFVGRRGQNYLGGHRGNRIHQEFKRVAKKAGASGRAFYDLRRTFQTIGEGARDLSAVQAIMGHAAAATDMSATYRQVVDDERLRATVEHVRQWLFPKDDSQSQQEEQQQQQERNSEATQQE